MTRCLHIVVIDDNSADLLLAEEVFATFSNQVTVATYQSGQDDLKAIQSSEAVYPDVVLLDINMPQMSGLDVLQALKADERLKLISVVMLTTSVAPQDVTQAYSLFACSYMVKAADFSSFVQQVESFLKFWKINRLLNWLTPLSFETGSTASGCL
ncbi:response regulator [Deinococcus sp. Arct2-2]|uniref:response regulator n=1 Tax=Deinococcus sp. Arct2-2 TaxID=2568653 RepID=UPI0010A5041A|nr:response regulator [Deinococcus sp. Arct2-2]THF67870.1 response regulator [Deinococcus sp. Arct2-2]